MRDFERIRMECQQCCYAVTGAHYGTYTKADAHEADNPGHHMTEEVDQA